MYSLMSKFYSEIFPVTTDKISFAQKSSFVGKAYNILDVGCATGDLCLELAKFGHHVTGIDLDANMIQIAKRKKAENPSLSLDFEQLDMVDIHSVFSPNQFDQVVCLGNTIVHLTQLNKLYSFFTQVADILKPTGVFKGQILNYSPIISNKIKSLPVIETDLIRFDRFYQTDGSVLQFQINLKDKATNAKYRHSVPLLPLKYNLLDELLHNAGFQEIHYYSDFNLAPYVEDESFFLVFEAFK